MFNQPIPQQILQQRSVGEWFSLCSGGPWFDSRFGRKPKKTALLEDKDSK
jgi:hypothetical protein